MRHTIPSAALLFISFAVCAEPAATPRDQAQELLEQALASDGGAGLMAAVMRDGELVFSGVAGKADLEGDRGLTPDTPMRIGSVSKIITAALALKLAQDGRLDLDADIRQLVPEFPRKANESAETITPRRLADHTSGIRHYDFSDFAEANNQRHYQSLVEALPVFADDPLLHAPGAAHHYSSFGFNLLGIAAGRAAGGNFSSALMSEIAGPLGLANTQSDHPLALIPRRTRFYTVLGGRLLNTYWRDSSDYYPSGGLLSTAEDLVKLVHGLFEGDVLDREHRQLLLQETRSTEGPTGYSFGWQVLENDDGSLHYEHGGETNGAYAWVFYDPESSLLIAGASNYNVYPKQGQAAFFEQAMAGLRSLYEKP